MIWLSLLFGLGSLWLTGQQTTPAPESALRSRERYLESVDSALASRDPRKVAAIADTAAWREADYPDLETLKMTLPEGSLKRYKDLSETSVLYHDAAGRSWRLTLARGSPPYSWKAVIRANPCPKPLVRPRRGPKAPEATPTVTTWTVLECWPLPM
jgi:hypothetical protein